jgi:hypothetical protein
MATGFGSTDPGSGRFVSLEFSIFLFAFND